MEKRIISKNEHIILRVHLMHKNVRFSEHKILVMLGEHFVFHIHRRSFEIEHPKTSCNSILLASFEAVSTANSFYSRLFRLIFLQEKLKIG